jgi:hypothetical protein
LPPPEKSALTGDENADASRGTDGSNPFPSSGESSELGIALTRWQRRRIELAVIGEPINRVLEVAISTTIW